MINKSEVSGTRRRIERILDRINTHPEYSKKVREDRIEYLRKEATRHSMDLEARGEEDAGVNPGSSSKDVFSRLQKAWDYLGIHGIDVTSLSTIGEIVEPRKNSVGYRKKDVAIGKVPPADPEKLLYLMGNLASRLSDDFNLDSVDRAIEAHLGICGIHPYGDGNGRISRLLQNFCLEQRNYPSAVIPRTERDLYIGLLQGALGERFSKEGDIYNPGPREREFHSLIESKILTSVENLDEDLRKRRIYDVRLNGLKDKGQIYSIKKIISGAARSNGHEGAAVSVSYNGGKKADLTVTGDIGMDELAHALGEVGKKYGVRIQTGIHKGCCQR